MLLTPSVGCLESGFIYIERIWVNSVYSAAHSSSPLLSYENIARRRKWVGFFRQRLFENHCYLGIFQEAHGRGSRLEAHTLRGISRTTYRWEQRISWSLFACVTPRFVYVGHQVYTVLYFAMSCEIFRKICKMILYGLPWSAVYHFRSMLMRHVLYSSDHIVECRESGHDDTSAKTMITIYRVVHSCSLWKFRN